MRLTKLSVPIALLATQAYAAPLLGVTVTGSGSGSGSGTVGGGGAGGSAGGNGGVSVGTGGIVGGVTGTTGGVVGTANGVVGGTVGTANGVVGGTVGTANGAVGGAVGTANGAANAGVDASVDLMIFANDLLQVTIGDASATANGLIAQLALTATSQANVLTAHIYEQCLAEHSDEDTCLTLAAYLAAIINAEATGYTGIDLLAALGDVHVSDLLNALDAVCTTSQQACHPLTIIGFLDGDISANVDADVTAAIIAHLQTYGYMGFINDPNSLLGLLHGLNLRSIDVTSFNHVGADTVNHANVGELHAVVVGNADAYVLADVHATKRDMHATKRIVPLNRPLTVVADADADVDSTTTLHNGHIVSNTDADADVFVGVVGRDLASAYLLAEPLADAEVLVESL